MADGTRDSAGLACREARGEWDDHRELGDKGDGSPRQEREGEAHQLR